MRFKWFVATAVVIAVCEAVLGPWGYLIAIPVMLVLIFVVP